MQEIEQIGAFESNQIICRDGATTDSIVLTGHNKYYRQDLLRLQKAGVRMLRYPIRWHQIEREPGDYDFSWQDKAMAFVRQLGFTVIADPCHMLGHPLWLKGGFLNPEFPQRYLEFYKRCARRYPWVTHWTPFNEPFSTAVMTNLTGHWYPWNSSDQAFVRAIVNMAKSICMVSAWLVQFNPALTIVQVEPLECHRTFPAGHPESDEESHRWTGFLNERRFITTDMFLGRMNEDHPLWNYIRENGFTLEDAAWFRQHAARVDVMGWDYYAHNSEQWWQRKSPGRIFPSPEPIGFMRIMLEYLDRYPGYNIMLTETNFPGYTEDRLVWLKYMLMEYEKVQRYLQFTKHSEKILGFCWFPSIDSHGWSEVEMGAINDRPDVNGIWWLSKDCKTRNASVLSEWYARIARGECTWRDIPVFPLNRRLARDVAGYHRLMPFSDVVFDNLGNLGRNENRVA